MPSLIQIWNQLISSSWGIGGVVRGLPFCPMPGLNDHLTSGSVAMWCNSCAGVRFSVLAHVQQAGAQLGAVERHSRRRLPSHRRWCQGPKRLTRIEVRIGGPGNPSHRIIRRPVAGCAALEGRPHSWVNNSSAFCRFEWKGVSAEHGVIMRMAVIALAGVVLRIGRVSRGIPVNRL